MISSIVGISGYATAGKNAASEALVAVGYKQLAFADELRKCLYTLNPHVPEYNGMGGQDLREIVDQIGWDVAKVSLPEIRRLMQVMGTEVGRSLFGDNVWVDKVRGKILDDISSSFVITDVRFPSEISAVRAWGGKVVWISRPGVGPTNGHASENSIGPLDCDIVIENDGSLEDLHTKIVENV
jgi:hypothetical protein